jgi:hypothetical protein
LAVAHPRHIHNPSELMFLGYGNDSRQSGPFGDFADSLLCVHLDASFIFNHLETMNGGPNFSYATAPRKKAGL